MSKSEPLNFLVGVNKVNIYLMYSPKLLYHKQDMIQGQFLAEYSWFEYSFLSPRLVALASLNNLVWPSIYS